MALAAAVALLRAREPLVRCNQSLTAPVRLAGDETQQRADPGIRQRRKTQDMARTFDVWTGSVSVLAGSWCESWGRSLTTLEVHKPDKPRGWRPAPDGSIGRRLRGRWRSVCLMENQC